MSQLTPIETWECHLCGAGTAIKNNNQDWVNGVPEPCKNTDNCTHNRCDDCFDINDDDERVRYCDGRPYGDYAGSGTGNGAANGNGNGNGSGSWGNVPVRD